MEPQQERGFWSQLTTFSKVLIFLVVLGILGGSAWYIYNSDKEKTVTATPSTDTIAVSEGANTSVNTDAQASDVKETVKEEKSKVEKVEDVAVDVAHANKKMKPIVKKITTRKTETAPVKPKPKKKTKNNEDVEVDI